MSQQDPSPLDPGQHDYVLAAQFYATLMGGRLEPGPPPADSALGWLLAHPDANPEQIGDEMRRRGVPPTGEEAWAWENPLFRRPNKHPES